MDIRVDLNTALRNSSSTISATIPLRFRDFSKNEFLLVLSQALGFQPNGPQIGTQHPRKPILTCPLLEKTEYCNSIGWKPRGIFLEGGGEGLIISGKKIALDFLLDERRIPGKFGCTGTYCIQMHEEQTDKQTNILLYIYRLRTNVSSSLATACWKHSQLLSCLHSFYAHCHSFLFFLFPSAYFSVGKKLSNGIS